LNSECTELVVFFEPLPLICVGDEGFSLSCRLFGCAGHSRRSLSLPNV